MKIIESDLWFNKLWTFLRTFIWTFVGLQVPSINRNGEFEKKNENKKKDLKKKLVVACWAIKVHFFFVSFLFLFIFDWHVACWFAREWAEFRARRKRERFDDQGISPHASHLVSSYFILSDDDDHWGHWGHWGHWDCRFESMMIHGLRLTLGTNYQRLECIRFHWLWRGITRQWPGATRQKERKKKNQRS